MARHDWKPQPEEHYEHRVTAGELDAQIDQFCAGLKSVGRPVFVRIGYEFNRHWNGYKPVTYKVAFRRVTKKIRKAGLEDVATVWCFGPCCRNLNFMSFYPGDDVVDWWAIDLFHLESMTMKKTEEFMAASLMYRRPVMIGESAPKGVRLANGFKSWDAWFKPYFRFIQRHKNVKADCYINQDWDAIGTWKGCGDSRLSQNAEIREKSQEKIGAPMFLHGANREQTLKALHVQE